MDWDKTKEILKKLTGREFGDSPYRAYLTGADLRGADLRRADLTGADLRRAYLTGADLRGADLRGADLRGADLTGADLTGDDLTGADLTGADLRRAYLTGADLTGAYLSGADLRGADLFSFTAGQHFGYYVPWQRYLKIGCVGESLDWWLENYRAAGTENGYAPEEIARYGAVIRLIAELYPAE